MSNNEIIKFYKWSDGNSEFFHELIKYGLFLFCNGYPDTCHYTNDMNQEAIEAFCGKDYLICPVCNSELEIKRNRKGSKFLGYLGWSKCSFKGGNI